MATAAGVERTAEVPNMEGGRASDKADERKDKDKEEEQDQSKKAGEEGKEGKKERTRYSVELTVEVVVEGALSMMDLLKGIQKQCGTVDGCRVTGEQYEVTMRTVLGKMKLMEGLRVNGAAVHAKNIMSTDVTVSFLHLPVYLQDKTILNRLEEWGVKPISDIKKRVWPDSDIADGTRFLRVRFNNEVRSLPYSTKFDTVKGAEYFRVLHNGQVPVCRLCIKPGHIFRECPDFKCHRCYEQGHYAKECRYGAEREKRGRERGGRRQGGRRGGRR